MYAMKISYKGKLSIRFFFGIEDHVEIGDRPSEKWDKLPPSLTHKH